MQKENPARRGPQLRMVSLIFVVVALALSAALLLCGARISDAYARMESAGNRHADAVLAARDMTAASDYLTDQVRCLTVTGDVRFVRNYVEEVRETRRRDRAVQRLETLFGSGSAYQRLAEALRWSNELMEREYGAMRLVQTALGWDESELPEEARAPLSDGDSALSPEEQLEKARSLVFDEAYMDYKARINENAEASAEAMIEAAGAELDAASGQLNRLLAAQTALTAALLAVGLVMVIFIATQVRIPLTKMVRRMRDQQLLPSTGAEELRFVARTYNEIFEQNMKANQQLTYEASHDALTGLYNRRAYEMFMQSIDLQHTALLIVDVDKFKSINDIYGHDGGDMVLRRVADQLREHFRSVDIICRIGGDEFAVFMTRVTSALSGLVVNKVNDINHVLQHPTDGTPPASVSVGVAFGDRKNPQGDLFKDADTALYRVKYGTRCGCSIFE